MKKQSFKIKAADGHLIPCINYVGGAKNLLIASHGITTEKTEEGLYTNFARNYLSPTFDVIVFDFRGHGDSNLTSKEVTISGEVLDFMAVINWAKEKDYDNVSHLATSFGASITLLAASVYDLTFLSHVVFWNPVINYRNTFINAKTEWGKEFYNQNRIEELAYKPFIRIPETDFYISAKMTQEMLFMFPEKTTWPHEIPLLIIHGDRDTVVPFDDALRYYKLNSKKSEFVRIRNVDHGFDYKIDDVMKITKGWLLKI